MSYLEDMMSIEDECIAVGWLELGYPYSEGDLLPEFHHRVKELAGRWFKSVEALGWGVAGGFHTCGFCGKAWGSGTFGVPWGDRLFFAPELISHYVESHRYAPPAEFVSAVLACPLPGTPEYTSAVARFASQTG